PPHLKRSGKIGFKPTRDERTVIEYKAAEAGLSVAEFVRLAALGHPVQVRHGRELSPPDRLALQRIGVNLNQIAKHMNAGRDAAADAILAAVADWQALVEHLRQ
ncbi:plasmid mobilization relaxosome protein MobC, partial [Sinorhizobium meliloti]|uniref:plasmid mobilization protein n=1 Tax=Rhizobium meliloti TaxID=382 RepID=UPI0012978941